MDFAMFARELHSYFNYLRMKNAYPAEERVCGREGEKKTIP